MVPAPRDRRGNVVDVEKDAVALAALHRRVDSLHGASLDRSLQAARRYSGGFGPDGSGVLHTAVDQLLQYNRLIVKLCLDGTVYLVTGERVSEWRVNDEYGLMAALQESGILDEPIADDDLRRAGEAPRRENSSPVYGWLASLIVEATEGQRLTERQRSALVSLAQDSESTFGWPTSAPTEGQA